MTLFVLPEFYVVVYDMIDSVLVGFVVCAVMRYS